MLQFRRLSNVDASSIIQEASITVKSGAPWNTGRSIVICVSWRALRKRSRLARWLLGYLIGKSDFTEKGAGVLVSASVLFFFFWLLCSVHYCAILFAFIELN